MDESGFRPHRGGAVQSALQQARRIHFFTRAAVEGDDCFHEKLGLKNVLGIRRWGRGRENSFPRFLL
jgi:hypothetical protein